MIHDPCIIRLPRNLVYTCEECEGRFDATDYEVDVWKAYDGRIERVLCTPCMIAFTKAMHHRRAKK